MAVGWPWGGRGVAVGWLWGGRGVAVGWPWGGRGVAVDFRGMVGKGRGLEQLLVRKGREGWGRVGYGKCYAINATCV